MSNITLVLSEDDVLSNVDSSQAASYYGSELLEYFSISELINAAGGIEEIVSDLSDEQIDREFLTRHPNPSEVLDHLDDEAIIDYLINKGYNIEM